MMAGAGLSSQQYRNEPNGQQYHITLYAEGLEAYRTRRWSEARRACQDALHAAPGDGPSLTLLSRLERIELDPPAETWDGSWSVSK